MLGRTHTHSRTRTSPESEFLRTPGIKQGSIRLPSILGALLCVGVAGLPVYVVESGFPQVAHFLVALYIAAFFVRYGLAYSADEAILVLLASYMVGLEGIKAFNGVSPESFLPIVYLLFNTHCLNSIRRGLCMAISERFLYAGFLAAVVVAGLGVFLGNVTGIRATGTFNNPNQLGYFSVCLASLGFLFHFAGSLPRSKLIVILGVSIVLAILSLSKAAMLSIAIVTLLVGFQYQRSVLHYLVGFLFVVGIVVGVYYAYTTDVFGDTAFVNRLEGIGQSPDDTLGARGYFSWAGAAAHEVVLGLGSEKTTIVVGHEVHSTVFSFYVRYGLIGGVLFTAFLALWLVRVFRAFGAVGVSAIVVPPMLYGLAHNGSRFTMFWILIAVSSALCQKQIARHRRKTSKVARKPTVEARAEVRVA